MAARVDARLVREGGALKIVGPYFEPRDVWFGVFWDRSPSVLKIFVCLIPCFPIRIELERTTT